MLPRLLALAASVLALGCSTGHSEPPATPAQPQAAAAVPPPATTTTPASPPAEHAASASLEMGKKIFGAYCASCHGPTAEGNGPAGKNLTPAPANLTQHRRGPHKSGKTRWQIIMTGSEGTAMVGFAKTLKPEQLDHLHTYLRQVMHGNAGPCAGNCQGKRGARGATSTAPKGDDTAGCGGGCQGHGADNSAACPGRGQRGQKHGRGHRRGRGHGGPGFGAGPGPGAR